MVEISVGPSVDWKYTPVGPAQLLTNCIYCSKSPGDPLECTALLSQAPWLAW